MFTLASWQDVAPLGRHPGRCHAWLTAPRNHFFTINPTPTSMHEALGLAWDSTSSELSRWALEVEPAARVLEIHRPDDWAALVSAHPDDSRTSFEGWEINSSDRRIARGIDALEAVPNQRAVRTRVRRFLEPDWKSVAESWDAVHLSWAGFLTAEGTVCDLVHGDVAMLRGWGSERAVWLNPVLSNPQPIAPDPDALPGRLWPEDEHEVIDLHDHPERFQSEGAFLRRRLEGGDG